MERRQLGKSDLKVTPLAFGAWAIGGWAWGGAKRKDAIDAIHKTIDLGITTIDTAPAYGFGLSEELIGEVTKGKRHELQILTKYGLRWDTDKGVLFFETRDNEGNPANIYKYAGKESVIHECENSLRRLQTDYIDLFQIHWPDPTTPVEETMEAIQRLMEQGKIRAVGVCNYDKELLDKATGEIDIVSLQVPYSMVRRDIEEELVPYCLENEIGILAYSPMQRGLLTGKFSPDHEFNEGDSREGTPYFKKENIKRTNEFLEEIKPIADSKNVSLAELVLRWTMEQPGITCALAGARNPQQVEDNAGAMSMDLSEEELNVIQDKLDELELEL